MSQKETMHHVTPRWPVRTLVALKTKPEEMLGTVVEEFNFTNGTMLVQYANGEIEAYNPNECVVWREPPKGPDEAAKKIAKEYAGL